MEKIEHVAKPKIGNFYLVPTVLGIMFDTRPRPWPVIGPLHDDKGIIGFEPRHYHIDARFLSPKHAALFRSPFRPLDTELFAYPLTEYGARGSGAEKQRRILGPVVYRRRKMFRQYPVFPRGYAAWMTRLENAFADRKLSASMRCPHRGAPLRSIPPDANGVITCPLHGLRWCARTGKLVRTTVE